MQLRTGAQDPPNLVLFRRGWRIGDGDRSTRGRGRSNSKKRRRKKKRRKGAAAGETARGRG
jgi:hypothetical protein